MATVNPLMNFDGNCEEAFNFYRSVFGGEFAMMMRFKDGPPEMKVAEEYAEKVMHVALQTGAGSVLMGSDFVPGFGPPFSRGNASWIVLGPDSEEDARRLFDDLSAGGSVMFPLEKAFWGGWFGMFTDKFGVQWMVNFDENRKG